MYFIVFYSRTPRIWHPRILTTLEKIGPRGLFTLKRQFELYDKDHSNQLDFGEFKVRGLPEPHSP